MNPYPGNFDYAGVLEHRMLNRENGQPHFARLGAYQVTPAYRYDVPDLRGWQFQAGYGICRTNAVRRRCDAHAGDFPAGAAGTGSCRFHPASFQRQHPLSLPRRFAYPHLRSPNVSYTYTHGCSLPRGAFGREGHIDPEAGLGQAVRLCVALGLYATPRLGLAPVEFCPGRTDRASLTCDAVTVEIANGAMLELNRQQEAYVVAFALPGDATVRLADRLPPDHRPAGLYRTRRHNTPRRTSHGPFLSGDLEDENIWLTAEWTSD